MVTMMMLLLALCAPPAPTPTGGACYIASEVPAGSGRPGPQACVNAGDLRSCLALNEAFGSMAWARAHLPRYAPGTRCLAPVDPFTAPGRRP